MHRSYLLIVTALGEGATGLLLLLAPTVPLELLLGSKQISPEAAFFARIAGAALVAIGIACWLGRSDKGGSALFGLLSSVLVYDVAAAAILAYTGCIWTPVGIALWPAVVAHAALAVWCLACIWDEFAKRKND